MSLAAAILTLNEARFIEACLVSVLPLTDNVLVLDSGSTDETVEIARRFGARVHTRAFTGFASQRNAALDLLKNTDWVLFVDADERLTEPLRVEIRDALQANNGQIAGYWIARRNVVCGRILRGGGWWPDYQLRLLQPGRARYDEARQVHEFPEVDGDTLAMASPLVHLNYRTWREFVARQIDYARYATPEHVGPPRRLRSCLAAPPREFWRRFVTLNGYQDGLTGIGIAGIMAAERGLMSWKARQRSGKAP